MISEATRDNSPLDYIVVWKLNRFSMSLEETIELRDKLRRVGTRLVSTIDTKYSSHRHWTTCPVSVIGVKEGRNLVPTLFPLMVVDASPIPAKLAGIGG